MKSTVFFMAGAALATATMIMINPVDMRKMRKRCKYAKKMINGIM